MSILQPLTPTKSSDFSSKNSDVRASIHTAFEKIPLFEEFLTHLTGCPYEEQQPLLNWKPKHYVALYSSAFTGGIALSTLGMVEFKLFPLILIGWLLTIGGVSGYQLGLIHNCSHQNVTRTKRGDKWLARILAVLIIMPDADSYTKGHRHHHQPKTHQTKSDNTIRTLFGELGFKPGMPISFYWKQLWQLINPLFIGNHIVFRRFCPCFIQTTSFASKIVAWILWSLVAIVLTLTHNWLTFLVAYCIPVLGFYSIIHFLRLCIEHKALPLEIMNKRDRVYVALSTDAVFLGEVTPDSNLKGIEKLLAWSGWWCRMLCWHGMIRWLICPADVSVHDYHTRMAGSPHEKWEMAIWERHQQQKKGCPNWPTLYTEQWGFIKAMHTVFASFSQLPQDYEF